MAQRDLGLVEIERPGALLIQITANVSLVLTEIGREAFLLNFSRIGTLRLPGSIQKSM